MALPALLNIALLLLLVMFIFSVFGMTMFKQVSNNYTQYGLYWPGYTGRISKFWDIVVCLLVCKSVCVFKVGQCMSNLTPYPL